MKSRSRRRYEDIAIRFHMQIANEYQGRIMEWDVRNNNNNRNRNNAVK